MGGYEERMDRRLVAFGYGMALSVWSRDATNDLIHCFNKMSTNSIT